MATDPTTDLGAAELVVFDIDGVLTDGRIYLAADGSETKTFHVRDGFGIRALREAGVEVAVISGRSAAAVEHRMRALGVARIYQGRNDKLEALHELLAELSLEAGASVFMGDDVPDLPVMRAAGLAATVRDAHPEVRESAHWISDYGGGQGAARQLCDCILEARAELGGKRVT